MRVPVLHGKRLRVERNDGAGVAAGGDGTKTRPNVRCDLSSIVRGYAVDRLWTELPNRGLTDFLIDVGGEVRARGGNEAGAPWQVDIERPSPSGDAFQRLVPISNLAITTLGDYRKYREVRGQRVAHILDPRTAGR